MSNLGIRTSHRVIPVGHKKPDWTRQSLSLFDSKGEPKKPRRKCLRNQVLVNGLMVETVTVNKVEKIRVPVVLKNGQMGERERSIGLVNGRRVYRDGYSYANVKGGKTPGRWLYA